MNAQITSQPSSPGREVKFRIRPALATAGCCAVVAFLAVQLVGYSAGVEFAVRTVAGTHFALATGIVSGFSTVMFAMDDKDDREVRTLPTSRTPRPHEGPRPTLKRAA